MIRVGFVLVFKDHGWLGGISYFRNLFSALYELSDREVEPVIITGESTDANILSDFAQIEVVRTRLVETDRLTWKLRRVLQLYVGRDFILEALMNRHGIRFLSHSGHLGRHCTIPTLPWIPDFQELHLSGFFSDGERLARSKNVSECCNNGTAVLVSSHAAREDLIELNAECGLRSEVLQFVAAVPPADSYVMRQNLEQRYEFSGGYFYLPNQFWAHKNHRIVLEALSLLKSRGKEMLILATGNMGDHRQPGHFDDIMALVDDLSVSGMFRPLGVVSYTDVMSLMRASVGIINPSLFEGWSTTVEEAKSMGKSVVLSDIPVHREQAPERGVYFAADSAESLAEVLSAVWTAWDEIKDREYIDEALSRLPSRRKSFAKRYQRIVQRVSGSSNEQQSQDGD